MPIVTDINNNIDFVPYIAGTYLREIKTTRRFILNYHQNHDINTINCKLDEIKTLTYLLLQTKEEIAQIRKERTVVLFRTLTTFSPTRAEIIMRFWTRRQKLPDQSRERRER